MLDQIHQEIELCGKCSSSAWKVTCPKYFPIDCVAITCMACGSVICYVDNLLILTLKEAMQERRPRQWVVQHAVAHRPSEFEAAREMILMGLEGGLTDFDIAETLSLPVEYVSELARKAGY